MSKIMASRTEDKPFCCTYPGCRQKFANVDRLNVHQETHKQDNNLKIKMGLVRSGDQLVDQTPTPTRFLKNCDEEGLFQELNPFEGEMKAQIQIARRESAHDDGPSGVETLAAVASVVSANASPTHTSSASEIFENGNGSITPVGQLLSPVSSSDGRLSTGSYYNTDVVVPVPPPAAIANPDASIPMAVAPMNLPRLPTSISSPTKSGTVGASTKKRLQEVISRQAASRDLPEPKQAVRSPPRLVMPVPQPPQATRPLQPTPKLIPKASVNSESSAEVVLSVSSSLTPEPPVSTSGVSSSADSTASPAADSPSTPEFTSSKPGRKRASEEVDAVEKRARFLQRNREAATRCREKRKQWIQTLEKRSQELARQNAQLQSEVASLRNERAHLKLLLLSHKDCPVTQQQQKQLNATSPKVLSTTTTTSTATPTVTAPAAATTSTPITPVVMFPLTADGLQVAAAAVTTPTIDLSTLNFLQQFQQTSQQPQQQQPAASAAATLTPTISLTPSAQQLQALFTTAQQLSLLQMIQQQQQQQQQQPQQQQQQDVPSESAPTPSDGSLEVHNGTDSEVTVVEIAMETDSGI